MPRCVQPGHRLAATPLMGASRYLAKLALPQPPLLLAEKCLILGRVKYIPNGPAMRPCGDKGEGTVRSENFERMSGPFRLRSKRATLSANWARTA